MSIEGYGGVGDRPREIDQAIDQLLESGWNLPSLLRRGPDQSQLLPINMFEDDQDLVVVMPMPGMEPENIDLTISGDVLTVRSELRGPGQLERRYLRHEWTYGPYHRMIKLPFPVNADRANASYNNGVLTVSLPRSAAGRGRRIELRTVGSARGQTSGHAGHQRPNVQ